jgi:uncharacterized glyoxalase superfamily protein PhnB
MKILEITPVLIVDAIEPVLPTWVDALGFQKVAEVPHGKALGFVMLVKDGRPVMLQTRASVQDDSKSVANVIGAKGVALYINVDSLAAAQKACAGMKNVLEERETFYGAREFGVVDASGQVLMFAEDIKK